MVFGRPAFLLAWAGVALAAWLALRAERLRADALARLGAAHAPQSRRWRWRAAIFGLALLALALAQPRWGQRAARPLHLATQHLALVVDLSRSMEAEQPSRRDRMLRVLRGLADELDSLPDLRICMVAFAGQSQLLFPETRDVGHLRHTLARLATEDLPSLHAANAVSGTRLGAALRHALKSLPPQGARAILLLSDGDDPADDGEAQAGAAAVAQAGVPVHVIAVGTPGEGFPIPTPRGILQSEGRPVETKLGEDLLRKVAQQTRGAYVPASMAATAFRALPTWFSAADRAPEADDEAVEMQDLGAWLLWPSLGLLASTVLGPLRAPRARARLAIPALALALLGAEAAGLGQLTQARQAFEARDLARAAELLRGLQSETPDPGLVAYNLGEVQMESKEFRAAELSFRRCLEDDAAPAARRARAWHQLGVALLRQPVGDAERFARAAEAFRTCLNSPDLDPATRRLARFNLELAQLLWLDARRQPTGQAGEPDASAKAQRAGKGPADGEPDKTLGGEPDAPGADNEQAGSQAGAQKSPKAQRGRLTSLPDTADLYPLTSAETQAQLEAVEARLAQARQLARRRPDPVNSKDW